MTIIISTCYVAMLSLSMAALAQSLQSSKSVADVRIAAEAGDAEAQQDLGLRYLKGDGVGRDLKQAVNLFRSAAAQGHRAAQLNLDSLLCYMYYRGDGLPKDDAAALNACRKAAQSGEPAALMNLGFMYAQGRGVAQDHAEAVGLYRKAADRGETVAAWGNLGIAYDRGRGGTQDYSEAVRWYRKAADRGDADAQIMLGFMYALGHGVGEDRIQAHMWFNLSAAHATGDRLESAIKARDDVEKLMTNEMVGKHSNSPENGHR